ncbi:D-aminoacyl-tRNA deacylase [Thermoanaerobacter uzonensis]|uniref:D-aminoacyl-tRNA deacylase n=1 Tax=Thermoanaerobacter uzonensis DSM 18761 TaxID=1123369 RepID=A0A1M5A0U7_9THEO|nr:D-aminoacyl-tRNA deacylase [Thermoanaerobacter uzonensis]SHF23888.1 D-tyrosyl-tRNA(Tyr) deacylase [Thermoanaerobacter uzonensis DSM 18761]
MRAVVQRVTHGEVSVDGELISSIGKGFVVLVGISVDDTEEDVAYMADKIVNLRVFEDEEGKMNLSLLEVEGEILLVSQFTLLGDVRKGRRPNFMMAQKPEEALKYFNLLVKEIENRGVNVKTGKFQAMMKVLIENDGPVTILIDSKKIF